MPHDAADAAVSIAMQHAWVAFARGGDPNTPGAAPWPRYTPQAEMQLEFGDHIATGHNPHDAALDFLHGYFDATPA